MDSQIRAGLLRLPSTLLLSIFVSSSIAQTDPTTASSSPTTLRTSQSPIPTATNQATPPPANSSPSATGGDNNKEYVQRSVFNYYFLIVAAIVILLGAAILYIRNRKKRKAALIRSHSQRALARDVDGFRSRFGIYRQAAYRPSNNRSRSETEEGLDERGEAPPPYVPGTKPPSIRTIDGVVPVREQDGGQSSRAGGDGETVELQNLSRNLENEPPSYDEHRYITRPEATEVGDENNPRTQADTSISLTASTQSGGIVSSTAGSTELTRPPLAVTASENFGSTRRLLNDAGSTV